jgi:hypothetical protein
MLLLALRSLAHGRFTFLAIKRPALPRQLMTVYGDVWLLLTLVIITWLRITVL